MTAVEDLRDGGEAGVVGEGENRALVGWAGNLDQSSGSGEEPGSVQGCGHTGNPVATED